MTPLLAIAVGALFAAGIYMMLRRSAMKLVIGLVLVGHAANLLIFGSSRIIPGGSPLTRVGETQPESPYTDPLPLALILTAIVISFAIVSYTIVLLRRTFDEARTDDLDSLRTTDR
ncbi:MAG: NADH-quinone oxidoreductase subunit K [Phycisphaeraceae bacterium]|nr:NADH-quinone oxidoreductase subunit K [Phycisphaeraceae bacterium]